MFLRTSYLSSRQLLIALLVLIAMVSVIAFSVVVLADKKSAEKSADTTQLQKKPSVPERRRKRAADNRSRGEGKNRRALGQIQKGQGVTITKGETAAHGEFNGDLSKLPLSPKDGKRVFRAPRERDEGIPIGRTKRPLPDAKEVEPTSPIIAPAAPIPTPSVSFKGLDFTTWGAGWPPDTVGDIGKDHYIQAVNTSVGIFNKTGTQLAAFTFDTLFAPLGPTTACGANQNAGDPTVIYDRMGSRWIVSDFAFADPNGEIPPFYQCIAVSKGNDPVTSGWWLYAIRTDDLTHPWFADYPKMGIWPDGLYMTANMFSPAQYEEVRIWAFNRDDLESGAATVRTVIVDQGDPDVFGMLPSNVRGPVPPSGRENILASESATLFAFEIWKFHVDYNTPANSTFVGPTNVSQTSYTVATATVTSPANSLDSIREQLMMQAQYRRSGPLNGSGQCGVGCSESLWVNHTVRTGAGAAPAGIQWAQINVTGGTIASAPVQQQIYGNLSADGVHRWMGSLAVDNQGNMALGYSASRNTLAPDIRYAGRLATDPLSTLPQTEVSLIPAAVTRGSQSGNCGASSCQRWGDYSSMSVDPTDDCTFWYTTEYYETTGLNWQTRIGAFKFPGCAAAPTAATASIKGKILSASGEPIAGVTVTLAGGSSARTITNAVGDYHFESLETGRLYTLTPSLANYRFAPENRSMSLVGNNTENLFTGEALALVDANAIDTNEFFVRQQYLDFLGREPEPNGLAFWSGKLDACGADAACLRTARIDVSAAFFQSQEFYDTGSFIYRLYRGALGRRLSYSEFAADRSHVVGGPNLESSKQAFAAEFVARSEFAQRYQQNNSAVSFVDALLQTMQQETGVDLNSQRSSLIARYQDGSTVNESRALVVRDLIDQQTFAQAVYNASFVEMEYMGYLRRGGERTGYEFWLSVLNDSDRNNYRGMVCSFITSAEYQRRFSSVVTRSNADCSH